MVLSGVSIGPELRWLKLVRELQALCLNVNLYLNCPLLAWTLWLQTLNFLVSSDYAVLSLILCVYERKGTSHRGVLCL